MNHLNRWCHVLRPVCTGIVSAGSTSVRVSRNTLSELERFRAAIRAASLDETLRSLLALRRKELIGRIYGSEKEIRRFRESVRLDFDR